MNDFIVGIAFVILSPGLILFTLWFWLAVMNMVAWAIDRVAPSKDPSVIGPYCDIDPRCHPAFVMTSQGCFIEGNQVPN